MHFGNVKKHQWLTKAFAALAIFFVLIGSVVPREVRAEETYESTNAASGVQQAAGATQTPSQQTNNAPVAAITDSGCFKGNLDMCLTNIVYIFTVGFMSIMAFVGGYILNIGVQLTLQTVTYSQSFLTFTWAAVRDLANMAFIFILIYLAIVIVLEAETSNTLKMLATTIVVALLINFSFFITRVVIDAGNILGVQFYNAIQAPPMVQTAQSGGFSGTLGSVVNWLPGNAGNAKDLTSGIMNLVGVQTLLSGNSFSAAFQKNTNFLTNIIVFSFVYIAVGAILALLAFTFIVAGIRFLVRVVILWLAIIASPLAFVARAITRSSTTQGWYKTWKNSLIEYSFYPAVFLFLFWIVNMFALSLSGCTTASTCVGISDQAFRDLAGANVSGGSFLVPLASAIASVGVRLGLVIILLFVAMKAADSIAKTGVGAIDKAGGKVAGTLTGWTRPYLGWVATRPQATARRAGGLVYRNTISRGARGIGNSLANSKTLNENSLLNRAAYLARQKVIKPVVDSRFLGTASLTEVDKYTAEREKDRRSNLSPIRNREALNEYSALSTKLKPLLDRDSKIKTDAAHLTETEKRLGELEAKIQAGTASQDEKSEVAQLTTRQAQLKTRLDSLTPNETSELQTGRGRLDALEKTISNFNKEQLEGFKTAELESIVSALKESQIKKIDESEKFTYQDKERLKNLASNLSSESVDKKLDAVVKEIRGLNMSVKKSGVYLEHMDAAIGTHALPRSTVLDSEKIKTLQEETSRHLADTRARIDVELKKLDTNPNGKEAEVSRKELQRLHQTTYNLQRLGTQLERFQEHQSKLETPYKTKD